MDSDTSNRFYETLKQLTDGKTDENPEGKGLTYARYRAVEFLKPEYRNKYKNAVHIGQTLAAIYRVHMVKRLEVVSMLSRSRSAHFFVSQPI